MANGNNRSFAVSIALCLYAVNSKPIHEFHVAHMSLERSIGTREQCSTEKLQFQTTHAREATRQHTEHTREKKNTPQTTYVENERDKITFDAYVCNREKNQP